MKLELKGISKVLVKLSLYSMLLVPVVTFILLVKTMLFGIKVKVVKKRTAMRKLENDTE